MIAELIPNQLSSRTAVALRTHFNKRDPLLVVHDVQRFALQRDRASRAVVLAVHLEATQIRPLLRDGPVLPLGDLSHALAAGVIYVICPLTLMCDAIGVVRIHCLP